MRGVALGTLLLLLVACGPREGIFESGKPRFPDAEGIVTEIDFKRVVIDEKRTYEISPAVESFSTYNGKVASLLSWKHTYVHLGLDGDETVEWIAGIGVLDRSREPPVVHYTGSKIERVDGRSRAIFEDGTVLRLKRGQERPPKGTPVRATIDPESDLVIELVWERA